ncbi:ribonuclease domain-containing protein [Longispora sp. K20-0274]|uniref:ribonuclease domain-containing protein n=1 Tax=Longispora sp. K20-0274 TaxID=3088255 RepID=UPI00399BAEF0
MKTKQKGLLASAAVLVVAVLAVLLIGKLTSGPTKTTANDGAQATASAQDGTAAPATGGSPNSKPRPKPTTAPPTPGSGLKTIKVADLPAEGRRTLTLIDQGGPFPYKQDGVIFENRDRRLPQKASGYYHEYTVVTPGESDRGARRLITGEDGDLYYTADHYDSFQQVLR